MVAFVIGTAELVVVGILELIAGDTGVSLGTAGNLVTAYALGIALGGPIIAALTARFGRRSVLQIAFAVFLLANLAAVAAAGFGMLLVLRVLSGSLHGLVAGVATGIAATLVAPERRGQAIAMVVGGITVSTVVGVPLGTLIGQALGWQAAFVAVVVVGMLALLGTWRFVPSVGGAAGAEVGAQTRAAFGPRVLAMLGIGLLIFAGQFTAFTYLTPYLSEVTGISGPAISVFLLGYGLAATAGTWLGGRGADHNPTATLLVANLVLVAALGALYLFGSSPVLAMLALGAWGLAGFAIPPALLLRVTTLARGSDQAATLGISAANAGIATGSVIGGAVIAGHGPHATVLVALLIAAVALPATWATRFLTPSVAGAPEAPGHPADDRADPNDPRSDPSGRWPDHGPGHRRSRPRRHGTDPRVDHPRPPRPRAHPRLPTSRPP